MQQLITVKGLALAAVMGVTPVLNAAQSDTEAGHATKHDIKRESKKAVNRVEEATCMEGDAACAGEKAKHRMEEAGDATKDKVEETKDRMD